MISKTIGLIGVHNIFRHTHIITIGIEDVSGIKMNVSPGPREIQSSLALPIWTPPWLWGWATTKC